MLLYEHFRANTVGFGCFGCDQRLPVTFALPLTEKQVIDTLLSSRVANPIKLVHVIARALIEAADPFLLNERRRPDIATRLGVRRPRASALMRGPGLLLPP